MMACTRLEARRWGFSFADGDGWDRRPNATDVIIYIAKTSRTLAEQSPRIFPQF